MMLTEGVQKVNATATIRGKAINLPLNLSLIEMGDSWLISGEYPSTLKQLNIINPTILKGVASFDDNVKILFSFVIPKKRNF